MSETGDFEAPVRLALGVLFEAVGNGAFLQLGGLMPGSSRVYGFLESPEGQGAPPARSVEASGTTVAETLIELAKRWQEPH